MIISPISIQPFTLMVPPGTSFFGTSLLLMSNRQVQWDDHSLLAFHSFKQQSNLSFQPYHHLPITPSSNYYLFSGLLLPPLNWSCQFCFVTHFCLFSCLQYPFLIKWKLDHCPQDSVQTLEHMYFSLGYFFSLLQLSYCPVSISLLQQDWNALTFPKIPHTLPSTAHVFCLLPEISTLNLPISFTLHHTLLIYFFPTHPVGLVLSFTFFIVFLKIPLDQASHTGCSALFLCY